MNSRIVESAQTTIHAHLTELVQKHAQTTYLRPIAEFSATTFKHFERLFAASKKERLIIDSGCGVGESTAVLAEQFPDAFVVGFDRSEHRTNKHYYRQETSNYAVLRAEVEDMWRLLLSAPYSKIIDFHALYYPNPYPKPRHIMRRWHGHPLLLPMLNLAPKTEVRTNWRIYAEEFAFAASTLGFSAEMQDISTIKPMTAFERKYQASGHTLFQVMVVKSSEGADS